MVTYRMVSRTQVKGADQQLNTALQSTAGERHLRHGMPVMCPFLYRIGPR